jgi:glycosyltransferase-like protein LARGE
MLEQQCAHWPHPIAAVVYIPMIEGRISSTEDDSWNGTSLEDGIEEVKQYAERMKTSKCIIDIELVVEERCTFEQATLYPTNAVRNRALIMSRSDIVLLLDVDFVVDLSLAYDLEDEQRSKELMDILISGSAVVLPAFEAWDQGERGKTIALTAVRQGKKYISKKFMYNIVMGFHMAHYPQGHEPTLFWKWINTSEPYPVKHETGFEPYILMLKEHVPYYDERFRGYYFNKVEQLMHISTQIGLPFIVHPSSFVVHVPHPKAKTKWRTKRSGQKERNHAMFLDAMEDIKLHRFVPVTSFPHVCLPSDLQKAIAQAIEQGKQGQGAEEQVSMLKKMANDILVKEH